MARKKNEDTEQVKEPVIDALTDELNDGAVIGTQDEPHEEEPLQNPAGQDIATDTKTEIEETETVGSKEPEEQEEISETVLNILKLYHTEKELYIDRFGGVFTPDTIPSIRSGATLYKNPFYTKKKKK